MIAIVNVSTHNKNCGEHEYELRINKDVIARFTHVRERGLAACLMSAAVAAEKARIDELTKWAELVSRGSFEPNGDDV